MLFKTSILASLATAAWAQDTTKNKHPHLRFTAARHREVGHEPKADLGSSDGKPTERQLMKPSHPVTFPYGSPCVNLPRDNDPHDQTLNNGWKLVDFCLRGATGAGPASEPDCHHNDDDSSVHKLSFPFTFYGKDYDTVFINNNGNLSFDKIYSTFTSTGFPVKGFPMVAPFWADVDTGDQYDDKYLGHTWMKELSNKKFAVTWENVGYYDENDERLNSFQLLISDGTDPAMGWGNNICFCYDDMEWTTGDASGGYRGVGGIAATVGTNKGNGKTSFQLGRFDEEGKYDGPPDVNYLDGKAICFDAADAHNIPPIPMGFPSSQKINLNSCEELSTVVNFLSPEIDQTTTVEVWGADGVTVTKQSGYTASVVLKMTPKVNGKHVLHFKAKDNKGGVTRKKLEINVAGCEQKKTPIMRCKKRDVRARSATKCYEWTTIDNGSKAFDGGSVTKKLSPEPPYGIGTTTVTLTAKDRQGRSDTCTKTVTVRQPRTGHCPA